jgi:uncharacterized protein YkwD
MDAPMQQIPRSTRPTRRRRRLASVTAAAGLTVLVSQCAPQQCAPAPAPATAPAGTVAQQVVALVNQQRAAAGLAPVTLHPALTSAAQGHSNYQASRNTMTHIGANGSDAGDRIAAAGYAYRVWGENVASGQPDASSVMQAWMDSEGHRDNILNPRFTDIGVGLAYSATGVSFWTEDFAAG